MQALKLKRFDATNVRVLYEMLFAQRGTRYADMLQRIFAHYACDEDDVLGMFERLACDEHLQQRAGTPLYLELLNRVRDDLLDEGRFNRRWLNGCHILKSLESLERKNDRYAQLGLACFDFDITADKLLQRFVRQHRAGRRQFGVIQNQYFPHKSKGVHWVALFFDFEHRFVFYFDSNGKDPQRAFARACPRDHPHPNRLEPFIFTMYKFMRHGAPPVTLKTARHFYQQAAPFADIVTAHFEPRHSPAFHVWARKGVRVVYNRTAFQQADGHCGTYAIFSQYFLCNRLKRMPPDDALAQLHQLQDSVIEQFKSHIFLDLPQTFDLTTLARFRRTKSRRNVKKTTRPSDSQHA